MPGDMTGIGPEITAKLLSSRVLHDVARVAVVGDARVLALGCRDAGVELERTVYSSVDEIDWSRDSIPVVDLGNIDPTTLPRGVVSAQSGSLTGETLKYMVGLALAGKLDGVCFAPLNKVALHRGGWHYSDEHQMFREWCGHTGFFGEMNVIREFATFRVTSHVSLRSALDLITTDRIMAAIELADRTLRSMGTPAPRIAVAALNPHAGENGLFGDEEQQVIRPALETMASQGVHCIGPVPADTVFVRAKKGEFDAVVTMYHDQGQIATKLLGFDRGVTVTAGLATVFATPAHGTAFDIVGQGKADPGALEQAVRLAARLAVSKRSSPTRAGAR